MISDQLLEELNIFEIDDLNFQIENESIYLNQFNSLKDKGLLKENIEFYDDNWICIYGGIQENVAFPTELEYRRLANILGLSIKEINLAWRSFLLKFLKLRKIRPMNIYLKSISKIDNMNRIKKEAYHTILQFIQYVKLSPNKLEEFQEKLDKMEDFPYETRTLPNFNSIFDFIDIINDIIENNKIPLYLEYIPIILWWKITSIIPLRPTEFLRIKFDCIYNENKNYYLRIYRTNAKKGTFIKNKALEENYYKSEIVSISEETFNLINYIKLLIQNNNLNTNGYLISDMFKNQSRLYQRKLNKNIYTHSDLNILLNKFYLNVIELDYHKKPISKYLKINRDNTIEKMNLYDSRHIAIINLILMGTEPQTVMELAGHNDIATTQGYYNHIENYVGCFSIAYAKRIKESLKNTKPNINKRYVSNGMKTLDLILNNDKKTKVDGGYCLYGNIETDKSFCFLNEGNHSICEYFLPDESFKIEEKINELEKDMITEIKVLRDLVRDRQSISNFSEKYSISTNKLKENVYNLSVIKSRLENNNGK